MTRAFSSRFSPRSLEPAQLERLTIGREQLLTHLERVITGAVVSGQGRFDLLVGPRGAGKSHCIGVLDARLRASAQVMGRAIVVAPPEELHPTSLVALLAAVLREFPDDPDAGPAIDALRSLQRVRDGDGERRAVELIRARLDGRSLVILLENLDELFEMLGREGQQRLRNILQTQRRWSIVASSRSLSPAFVKHEAPFHGTFNQHRLEPLSPEQCRDMLAALADAHGKAELAAALRTSTGLRRVHAIHHLLGGNPRTMAFVFRQLDADRLDHFDLALPDLADDIKPYFQAQTARLSPAQRGVMELLAESWRPLTVTELAEQGFTSQASTSGALRHLRRDQFVSVNVVGREHFYEIADPLHRLVCANERPRDAIQAFARVIGGWYADDVLGDFPTRNRYVLPDEVRSLSVAADGSQLGERAKDERAVVDALLEGSSPDEWLARASMEDADALCSCVYPWLASRRSPEPLRAILGRVPSLLERMPALACKTAREAVARLSEPEREFIRKILEAHEDSEGLAELGLNAASAAPRSRG